MLTAILTLVLSAAPGIEDDTDRVAAQVRAAIPGASAISLGAWRELASSPTRPRLDAIDDQPLSLLLLLIGPGETDPEREELAPEGGRPPKPKDISRELLRGRIRAGLSLRADAATLLREENISGITCDASATEATGLVRFAAEGLFEGRVHYRALRGEDGWRVVEFRFPARGLRTELGSDGTWKLTRSGAPGDAEKDGMELVWSDEFERAGAPDPEKWAPESGFVRNEELQYYTERAENARVEDGHLVIEARRERFPNPRHDPDSRRWQRSRAHAEYTSASLTTKGKASWRRGRIEVRARLPRGRGVWPAIWMLGENIDDVGWPACGEIDIMEYVGYEPDTLWANVHTQKYNHTRGTGKGDRREVERPWEKFHVWSLDWTDEALTISVDGDELFSFEKESGDPAVWPFDRAHYLILNLAIGGAWGGRRGVDEDIFPQRLLVDWVRVYRTGDD